MTMLPRGFVWYVALAALLVAGLITLLVLGPRWLTTVPEESAPGAVAAADARKIRARLFYVDELGTGLQGVEQEVVYGETTAEQARRIVEAQIAPAPAPHVSAIPAGTRLRTVFFTKAGEVYVDLSADLQTNHPGGTMNETLTVYALVSALTSNLPAVTGVQILIEGKEVDTLAGHLDLRRPIEQDLKWVTN
jgi:Sporulation and spore germination